MAAAELPRLVVPDGVGVNIHFVTGHERDLDMIAASGCRVIRMDLEWNKTESDDGTYNWSDYDELLRHLKQRGMRAMLILAYSHPRYEPRVKWAGKPFPGDENWEENASPRHPASIAAYAKWAAAAVKHFRGQGVIWELGNEPNGGFWFPRPDVHEYINLALATAKAVRAADPNATLVAPGLAPNGFATPEKESFDWDFIETFLSSGILNWLDGISVHPYRPAEAPPESVGAEYARLRRLIERYTPPSKNGHVQIVSGEWGYSSGYEEGSPRTLENTISVSDHLHAAYVVRQQLFNLASGIPLSIWYQWTDDPNAPYKFDAKEGLVTENLEQKPAYVALQTMARELKGFRLERCLDTQSVDDFALVFVSTNDRKKIVAWTTTRPHKTSLVLGPGIERQLPLENMPIYVATNSMVTAKSRKGWTQ